MATPLTIQSIVSDNKIYAQFSSKILPKYARNGELYVVDGILYIYTTLEGNGIGRWFPLTDQKDLFKFDQNIISNVWNIPVKWLGDNVQFIVYDQNDKVYSKKYDISTTNQIVTITFETAIKGTVYIVSKILDKNFNIGNGKFIVAEDPNNKGEYYVSIDTKFIEILPNGNVTFKKDFYVTGTTTLTGDLIVDKNVQINGNTNIDGNLTIKGNRVDINTTTLNVTDNIVTLNMGTIGQPVKNAGIEIDRGTEGLLPILTFNELNDYVSIPVKTGDTFTQDEVAGVTFTLSEINKELLRALEIENQLNLKITTTSNDLVSEVNRASSKEQEILFKLDAEVSRSKNIEIDLQTQITDITDVMSTDSERLAAIQKLTTEFQLADSDLNGLLTNLGSELNNKLDVETNRLTTVESNLIYLLETETNRVNYVTGEINTQLNNISTDILTLESTINDISNNVSGLISTELSDITANLDSEITRAVNAEATLNNSLSTETTNRINNYNQLLQSINDLQSSMSINSTTLTDSFSSEISLLLTSLNDEINRAIVAENNIQSGLDLEKGRIDSILNASNADKDSFKEIVDLINSIDVTNDTAFAGYVLSNDTRSSNIENSVVSTSSTISYEIDRAKINEINLQSKIDAMGTLSDFNTSFNANKL